MTNIVERIICSVFSCLLIVLMLIHLTSICGRKAISPITIAMECVSIFLNLIFAAFLLLAMFLKNYDKLLFFAIIIMQSLAPSSIMTIHIAKYFIKKKL